MQFKSKKHLYNVSSESVKRRLRLFENKVVSIIFDIREEVAGGWRRLHNEKFFSLSLHIIRMFKLRRMEWVGHAT
jgi:hypothetical protein